MGVTEFYYLEWQAVIDAQLIGPLVSLLQTAEFDIKKEAAWAISNATSGGTHDQIMYGCFVIISLLMVIVFLEGAHIFWILDDRYLVSQGCIKPLCDLLSCPDARIVTVCLEGLENILKIGEVEKCIGNTGGVNYYAQLVDEAEGLEKIENLQSHDNHEIYEKAVKILESYWLEEEDDNLPAGDGPQSGFNFGGNDSQPPPGGFKFG